MAWLEWTIANYYLIDYVNKYGMARKPSGDKWHARNLLIASDALELRKYYPMEKCPI